MKLIQQLKEAGQDHEFYPTTDEILREVASNLRASKNYHQELSVLDIGAGNGKALDFLRKEEGLNLSGFYAIEKSQILAGELSEEIKLIGTTFEEQSLYDKNADVTFCNPPYSLFSEWSQKIIRETQSRFVYLVIPQRWERDEEIAAVIKARGAESEILGTYSFKDAEDRKARATVHLVRIENKEGKRDSFAAFIEENFPKPQEDKEEIKIEKERRALVVGRDLISQLIELYQAEHGRVHESFLSVQKLDYHLLKSLQIDTVRLAEILREKLAGLKSIYWSEVFDRCPQLVGKLTAKNRREFRQEILKRNNLDFTEGNILAVVSWMVKRSNSLLESQVVEVWESIISEANVKLYKSNQRTFGNDGWRFRDEFREGKVSHVGLDLRCVVHYCGGIVNCKYGMGDRYNGLNNRAEDFLNDLNVVASSLGWVNPSSLNEMEKWTSGSPREFRGNFEDGREVFARIKAFKNQNIHIQFSKQFLCRLNVEYGRIKGWLLTGEQSAEELNDPQAARFFNDPICLPLGSIPLLGVPKPKPMQKPAKAKEKPRSTPTKKAPKGEFVGMDDLLNMI